MGGLKLSSWYLQMLNPIASATETWPFSPAPASGACRRSGISMGLVGVSEKGAYILMLSGSREPFPESLAKISIGFFGFERPALMASPRRLTGCIILMGRGGGRAGSSKDDWCRGFLNEFGPRDTGVCSGWSCVRGDPFSGFGTSSRRDPASTAPANSEERLVLSESSAESSLIVPALRDESNSSSICFSVKRLLALAGLLGLTCRRLYIDGSISFSDDISLLVVVSLLARCLTVSTAPRDPLRKRPSLDLLYEGIRALTPSFVPEPRMGDEPDRFLTGILENLICWAALTQMWASLE